MIFVLLFNIKCKTDFQLFSFSDDSITIHKWGQAGDWQNLTKFSPSSCSWWLIVTWCISSLSWERRSYGVGSLTTPSTLAEIVFFLTPAQCICYLLSDVLVCVDCKLIISYRSAVLKVKLNRWKSSTHQLCFQFHRQMLMTMLTTTTLSRYSWETFDNKCLYGVRCSSLALSGIVAQLFFNNEWLRK